MTEIAEVKSRLSTVYVFGRKKDERIAKKGDQSDDAQAIYNAADQNNWQPVA